MSNKRYSKDLRKEIVKLALEGHLGAGKRGGDVRQRSKSRTMTK